MISDRKPAQTLIDTVDVADPRRQEQQRVSPIRSIVAAGRPSAAAATVASFSAQFSPKQRVDPSCKVCVERLSIRAEQGQTSIRPLEPARVRTLLAASPDAVRLIE